MLTTDPAKATKKLHYLRPDGAPILAARIIGFCGPTTVLKWEDIQDIASEAWFDLWQDEQNGKKISFRTFKWRVLDHLRSFCGRSQNGKESAKSKFRRENGSFADISEDPIEDKHRDFLGQQVDPKSNVPFQRLEVEEIYRVICRLMREHRKTGCRNGKKGYDVKGAGADRWLRYVWARYKGLSAVDAHRAAGFKVRPREDVPGQFNCSGGYVLSRLNESEVLILLNRLGLGEEAKRHLETRNRQKRRRRASA